MVYIYDDEHIKVVNYLTFGVDKSIERVRLDETNEVLERLKGVQTQSPIVHHKKAPLVGVFLWCVMGLEREEKTTFQWMVVPPRPVGER